MNRQKLVMPVLLAALALLIPVAAGLGSTPIPVGDVVKTLFNEVTGNSASSDPSIRAILMDVRLPRVALMILVGGALALVGGVMQAAFKNPLADPGLLGVSAGGALGAVLAITFGFDDRSIAWLPVFAFIGSLIAVSVVFFLSGLGGPPDSATLLLTGVAIGSLATALMSYILLVSGVEELREILFWMVGGSQGMTWSHILVGFVPIALGSVLLLGLHRPLDALLLGEEQALSIGVNVARIRIVLIFLCAMVAGAAVSLTGAVGFVGLMVPHMLRFLTGPRAMRLLPACLVGGSVFLLACDLLARVLSRQVEIQTGIVTALLGVPFFLGLLAKSKRGRS